MTRMLTHTTIAHFSLQNLNSARMFMERGGSMSRSVKRARQTGVIHEPASARVLGCIKMVCPWEVSFNFYFFFLS